MRSMLYRVPVVPTDPVRVKGLKLLHPVVQIFVAVGVHPPPPPPPYGDVESPPPHETSSSAPATPDTSDSHFDRINPPLSRVGATDDRYGCYTGQRGEIAPGSRGRSGPCEASELLVSFALHGIRREPRREHRVARPEPAERREEQAAEQERHADLGNAERRRRPTVDRRHDLEVALQPDPQEIGRASCRERV